MSYTPGNGLLLCTHIVYILYILYIVAAWSVQNSYVHCIQKVLITYIIFVRSNCELTTHKSYLYIYMCYILRVRLYIYIIYI